MSDPSLAVSESTSDSEAFETLKQIAGRRTLPIPVEMLAHHTLALPGPWDWPVRRTGVRRPAAPAGLGAQPGAGRDRESPAWSLWALHFG